MPRVIQPGEASQCVGGLGGGGEIIEEEEEFLKVEE